MISKFSCGCSFIDELLHFQEWTALYLLLTAGLIPAQTHGESECVQKTITQSWLTLAQRKKNGLQVNPLPTLKKLSGYAENEWLKLKGDINK